MRDEQTASILAFAIIGGFFVLMIIVLTGFVRIESPEIAKLVGALFGYFTALINPIVVRYFKGEKP